uniref:Uncharacterized protein n=1 Tax=Glossina pallidipes TaxID=7398 RepID=A0A1A9ZMW6_GLOPL
MSRETRHTDQHGIIYRLDSHMRRRDFSLQQSRALYMEFSPSHIVSLQKETCNTHIYVEFILWSVSPVPPFQWYGQQSLSCLSKHMKSFHNGSDMLKYSAYMLLKTNDTWFKSNQRKLTQVESYSISDDGDDDDDDDDDDHGNHNVS